MANCNLHQKYMINIDKYNIYLPDNKYTDKKPRWLTVRARHQSINAKRTYTPFATNGNIQYTVNISKYETQFASKTMH